MEASTQYQQAQLNSHLTDEAPFIPVTTSQTQFCQRGTHGARRSKTPTVRYGHPNGRFECLQNAARVNLIEKQRPLSHTAAHDPPPQSTAQRSNSTFSKNDIPNPRTQKPSNPIPFFRQNGGSDTTRAHRLFPSPIVTASPRGFSTTVIILHVRAI